MPALSSKRLYIKGLKKGITEEELYKCLSCYGDISEVKIFTNYAFVQFEYEKNATTVVETYRHKPLFGKKIVVEFAHQLRTDLLSIPGYASSRTRQPAHRNPTGRYPVLILDIPGNVRWQELKDFGRLSGRLVAFCDLDKTQSGRGFIEYFTREDAHHAVSVLDGQYLGGRRVRVVDYQFFRENSRFTGARRAGDHYFTRYSSRGDHDLSSRGYKRDYAPERENIHVPNNTSHDKYSQSSGRNDRCPEYWDLSPSYTLVPGEQKPKDSPSTEVFGQAARASNCSAGYKHRYWDYDYYYTSESTYGKFYDEGFEEQQWEPSTKIWDDPYKL